MSQPQFEWCPGSERVPKIEILYSTGDRTGSKPFMQNWKQQRGRDQIRQGFPVNEKFPPVLYFQTGAEAPDGLKMPGYKPLWI